MHDPYDFTDIVQRPKKKTLALRIGLATAGVIVLSFGAFGFSSFSKKPQAINLVGATASPTAAPTDSSTVLGASATTQPRQTPLPVPTYSPDYSSLQYKPPADTSTPYPTPTFASYTPPPRVNYCSRAQITAQYNATVGSINGNYDYQIGAVRTEANRRGLLDSGFVQGQTDALNSQRQQELASAQAKEQADLAACSQP